MRSIFGNSDRKRLKKDVKPTSVDVVASDVFYYGDNVKEHSFDVLTPQGNKNKLPTIMHVHGGGFTAGDKSIYDNYARRLSEKGFTVVNINYGLAPKHPFPQGLSDVANAINYAVNNADKFLIDSKNIYLVGDSAGANLVASIATLYSNNDFQDMLQIKVTAKIRAIGLSCGIYDMTEQLIKQSRANKLTAEMYFQKRVNNLPPKEMYDICGNVTKDFSPTFITSCKDDFLYSQNVDFAKLLLDKGITIQTLFFDNINYPLGHVFNYRYIDDKGNTMKEAVIARDKLCDFFKSFQK